jgi:hypothetical protein
MRVHDICGGAVLAYVSGHFLLLLSVEHAFRAITHHSHAGNHPAADNISTGTPCNRIVRLKDIS